MSKRILKIFGFLYISDITVFVAVKLYNYYQERPNLENPREFQSNYKKTATVQFFDHNEGSFTN